MHHTTILKWSFGNKNIPVDIFWTTKKNRNVIINIHGVFNSKDDPLHRRFAENMTKNHQSQVVLFTSSRYQYPKNVNTPWAYETWKQQSFSGKTFYHELSDAEEVIKYITSESEQLFWYTKNELNIILNGNSLGGMIAFFIAHRYPYIKNISTVGTGIHWNWDAIPIMSTLPNKHEFIKILWNFKGKFLLHESWEDHKFCSEDFDLFYNFIKNDNKKRILYPGANHTFSHNFWNQTPELYDAVYKNICEYFL